MLLVFIGRNRFDLSRRFPGHTALNRSETRDRLAEYLSGRRRTAIVASHPDDETIGLGARLAAFENAVFFIVTDGAPENLADARAAGFTSRADYAAARARELEMVLTCSGVQCDEIQRLGLIDQRVSFCMYELACDLALRMSRLELEIVITQPYEGGHPDHDAAAFAAYAALGGPAAPHPLPRLLEMTSYHWTGQGLRCGEFLPSAEPETEIRYARNVLMMKQRMLRCFKSQRRVIHALHVPAPERFRSAPQYEFRRPPAAPGCIYYERFDWGLDSVTWCQYAEDALNALQIAPVASARTAQLWL